MIDFLQETDFNSFFCCQAAVKQNATAEQLKQRKTLAAAEREENQR